MRSSEFQVWGLKFLRGRISTKGDKKQIFAPSWEETIASGPAYGNLAPNSPLSPLNNA